MMEDLSLQRLIDGELSQSELRAFLQQVDREPLGWRTVALSLLEDQAFRQALGQVETTPHEPVVRPLPAVDKSLAPKPMAAWRRWAGTALAASLLLWIGFIGGNSMRVDDEGRGGGEIALEGNRSAGKNNAEASSHLPMMQPAGELSLVSDADAVEAGARPYRLPLYEGSPDQLSRWLDYQQQQVALWNQRLQRQGLQLQWQPEMLESRLPDGRAAIVPIHQIEVRPLGQ